MELQPSPVVALNKAIAAMYALGPSMALEQALAIRDLDQYYLYHTALGEIYLQLNRKAEARNSFLKAISLTRSKKELHLLEGKLEGC
jgi:predicted RNA polymerase sigma factor